MMRSVLSAVLLCLFLASVAMSAEFSADMVMDGMGGTNSGKLYFKNDDISRTEMMGMISITKRPMIYQLFEDTKKYVVTNIDEAKDKNPMADVGSFEEWIKKNKLRKVGTETLEGYRCDIFEGDVKFSEEHDPVHMKVWYNKKLGYPLKHESTLPQVGGKIVSYLKNIRLEKQPDSLFDIPAGYSEAKNMQEAMGMGGMPSMGQGGNGQAPSQEDMEKMMKEMMKRMEKQ